MAAPSSSLLVYSDRALPVSLTCLGVEGFLRWCLTGLSYAGDDLCEAERISRRKFGQVWMTYICLTFEGRAESPIPGTSSEMP